jgi:hypothetical protein
MSEKIALILFEQEMAYFYGTIEDASISMEAIDVRSGLYTAAFGPRGQIYRLDGSADPVQIFRDPDAADDPEELRRLLLGFLCEVQEPIPANSSLEALLRFFESDVQKDVRGKAMKPFTTVAVLIFALIALAHLYRIVRPFEVVVAGCSVPQWASIVGLVVAATLAVMVSRESRR